MPLLAVFLINHTVCSAKSPIRYPPRKNAFARSRKSGKAELSTCTNYIVSGCCCDVLQGCRRLILLRFVAKNFFPRLMGESVGLKKEDYKYATQNQNLDEPKDEPVGTYLMCQPPGDRARAGEGKRREYKKYKRCSVGNAMIALL